VAKGFDVLSLVDAALAARRGQQRGKLEGAQTEREIEREAFLRGLDERQEKRLERGQSFREKQVGLEREDLARERKARIDADNARVEALAARLGDNETATQILGSGQSVSDMIASLEDELDRVTDRGEFQFRQEQPTRPSSNPRSRGEPVDALEKARRARAQQLMADGSETKAVEARRRADREITPELFEPAPPEAPPRRPLARITDIEGLGDISGGVPEPQVDTERLAQVADFNQLDEDDQALAQELIESEGEGVLARLQQELDFEDPQEAAFYLLVLQLLNPEG